MEKYGIYKTIGNITILCKTSDSLENLQKDLSWLRDNNPGVKYEILNTKDMTFPIQRSI